MILSRIQSPADVRQLSEADLQSLAAECRQQIIETVSHNGGHLASNLGVVELTLALAKAFDFRPDGQGDALIFDVGHQVYTWKLLTGRQGQFSTLRQKDGLSGFPKREESVYDFMNTGHSSTSLSAALGLARAKRLQGQAGRVIALIGDGALGAGMAYEAMNDLGQAQDNVILILNDNKMSIDGNVGALSMALERMRISPSYLRMKPWLKHFLAKIPLLGKPLYKGIQHFKRRMRWFRRDRAMFFEELGFRYYGPVDGHDLQSLSEHLEAVKKRQGPVLLHVCTEKGHGYSFAEAEPSAYHGVAPFVIEQGLVEKREDGAPRSYTSYFGQMLCAQAAEDQKIVAITAAMRGGTGLQAFAEQFPERFYDVGIAEQHASTLAAGLALGGLKPYLCLYSTFAQRAVDQILHDICLQQAAVRLIFDHSGFVSQDGETHQGYFDATLFSSLPNLELWSPASQEDLQLALTKLRDISHPCLLRFPKGPAYTHPELARQAVDDLYCSLPEAPLTLIAVGDRYHEVQAAVEACAATAQVQVISLMSLSNRAIDGIIEAVRASRAIHLFEESVAAGSPAEQLLLTLREVDPNREIRLHCIRDCLREQAKRSELLQAEGLDQAAVVKVIQDFMAKRSR